MSGDWQNLPHTRPRRHLRGWVLSGAIGLVVGALAVGIGSGWVQSRSATNTSLSATPSSSSQPIQTQSVSVSVNDGIVQAVKKVEPAVVGVLNMQQQQQSNNPFTDLFPFPMPGFGEGNGGNNSNGGGLQESGSGTGFFFSKDGYIATNDHVISGASKVVVVLPSGKQVDATIVGSDAVTDLAVLKVPASDVSGVVTWGDSSTLQAGEPAIAIGNPLGMQFQDSVTAGVVSAPLREMSDQSTGYPVQMVQTDAAINFGNSGGPLLNISGQVIGINSQKISQTMQGPTEGLGFAIASNFAKPILQQLVDNGKVVRPYMGVSTLDLSQMLQDPRYAPYASQVDVKQGAYVAQVAPNSPAQAAGIQQGDVIVSIDGQSVDTDHSLAARLYTHQPGDTVKVTVNRQGKSIDLSVHLGSK